MANGGIPVGRLSRQILAAAFLLLLATVAASVFFVALTRSVSESLVEAQLASGAPEAPLTHLSDALLWGQASAMAALSLLTAGLFALAWFLRARLAAPLEAVKRSLAAASSGALAQPVFGVERRDEIGAVARAAERLRQAIAGGTEDQGPYGLKQLIERLSKDAARLEADLAGLSSATIQARTSIEEASVRAAKASFAAIEAAGIVRDGAERMTLQAEESVAALAAVIATRSGSPHAGASEPAPSAELAEPFAADAEAAAVFTSLADDLEALERFARDRRTIASEAAAALTVALVEAIDRLNGVADRISATADLGPKSEAA
jgi:HAMP domain-containing protein